MIHFLPALQTAIIEAAKEAGQFQRDLNVKNEQNIISKLRKQGVEVIEKNQYRALKP